MPNESLQRAYDVSNSGFEQKINSVVGVFQNQQKTALAKQQMRQQMEMRKELAQYQSDLQFDRRKRIYEEIQKPQEELDRRLAEQQKLVDSHTTAQKQTNDLRREHINETFHREYGLLSNYNFTPEIDPQTGIYTTQIYRINPDASEENRFELIDRETYDRQVEKARNVSSKLNEWQSKVDRLAEGEEFINEEVGDRTIQVTKDSLPEIIRDAQNDPQFFDYLDQAIKQQKIAPVYAEETIEGRGEGMVGFTQQLANILGPTNTLNFRKDNRELNYELNPNMTARTVREDVANFIREDLGIDIDQLNDEQIRFAMQGQDASRGELFEERSHRRIANEIAQQVRDNRDNMNGLMMLYLDLPNQYLKWADEFAPSGESLRMNQVRLNLNVTPDNVRNMFVKPTNDWQGSHQKLDQQIRR